MWRIIRYILAISIFIFCILYIMYQYEEKISLNNEIEQLKFNWLLLENLREGKDETVGALLSADIQRVLIDITRNQNYKKTNNLCDYIDKESINLLSFYDKNVSVNNIKQVVKYCKEK